METLVEDAGQGGWLTSSRRLKESAYSDESAAAAAREKTTPTNDRVEGNTTSAGRILVIDDEPAVARLTSLVLEQYGYNVDVVHSGAQALEQLTESSDVRLVLVDLTMPDISGTEVLRTARARGVNIPMILTSGYPGGDVGGTGNAEFAGYLQKPYKIENLIAAIRRALGEE